MGTRFSLEHPNPRPNNCGSHIISITSLALSFPCYDSYFFLTAHHQHQPQHEHATAKPDPHLAAGGLLDLEQRHGGVATTSGTSCIQSVLSELALPVQDAERLRQQGRRWRWHCQFFPQEQGVTLVQQLLVSVQIEEAGPLPCSHKVRCPRLPRAQSEVPTTAETQRTGGGTFVLPFVGLAKFGCSPPPHTTLSSRHPPIHSLRRPPCPRKRTWMP